MPRQATNNPRDSPAFTSGWESSRHNPALGIMAEGVGGDAPRAPAQFVDDFADAVLGVLVAMGRPAAGVC